MIVSHALTIGQITFILRIAIQILSYGGIFLIGLIVLGNTPRIASLTTHDLLNRVVGKSTAMKTSGKWAWNHLRGRNGDAVPSTPLLLSVLLLTLYGLFGSLSDIGFLGFYSCTVPGPSGTNYPASINTDDAARALVAVNLVNGTDPGTVKGYRCDSIAEINFGVNVTERNCTTWHNSTYANPTLFSGLNTTDSDVLMPRQLRHYDQPRQQYIDLNSYYLGPGAQRIVNPTISNGIAVDPHDLGLRAVLGVPQLGPQEKVTLNKTLAVEVDVGCMALGIYSQHDLDAVGSGGLDLFDTNGTWRKYTGPDYLQNVLSSTTDALRGYYTPLFNTSSLGSDGFMFGLNNSQALFSMSANIQGIPLPTIGSFSSDSMAGTYIFGNCTAELQKQLNLTVLDQGDAAGMCYTIAIGGSMTSEGTLYEGLSRFVCAAATQVNMVSASVETNAEGAVSLSLTRLPSDLNYLRASYWDAMDIGDNTKQFSQFMPIERFTLADNPAGPTSHYITNYQDFSGMRAMGPGSGGSALSRVGSVMLDQNGALELASGFAGITQLDAGYSQINFTGGAITQWSGQVGASYLLSSAAYNGWAARSAAPVTVYSTGGRVAACYRPQYAVAFAPLVCGAVLAIVWTLYMLFSAGLAGTKSLEQLYGGMSPYAGALQCPREGALLMWENAPEPHLEVISKGQPLPMDKNVETAVGYLRSGRPDV